MEYLEVQSCISIHQYKGAITHMMKKTLLVLLIVITILAGSILTSIHLSSTSNNGYLELSCDYSDGSDDSGSIITSFNL